MSAHVDSKVYTGQYIPPGKNAPRRIGELALTRNGDDTYHAAIADRRIDHPSNPHKKVEIC